MRHEFAPEAGNVLFSSCRPEAAQIQIGSADRDRRPFTQRAVGRRHRRPFGALLGSSDLNRVGTARDAVADCAAAAPTRLSRGPSPYQTDAPT